MTNQTTYKMQLCKNMTLVQTITAVSVLHLHFYCLCGQREFVSSRTLIK